jgi:hypothetical protein
VKLLSGIVDRKFLSADEATGLLRVITDYAYAPDLLDRYNHQSRSKSFRIGVIILKPIVEDISQRSFK